MATIKKTAKKMQMGGGTKPMMKKGGSFPDLNKDGKITKKDILIGKGVLPKTAKSGAALKKQAAVAIAMKKADKTPKKKMQYGGAAASMKPTMKMGGSLKPVDKAKNPGLSKLPTPVRNKMGYQKMGGKTTTSSMMKMGGKMTKKCMTGCK